MNKYQHVCQLGDGTYGTVSKAIHIETSQVVAVKKMKQKYYTWQECLQLAEVNVLRKLSAHPNVIKLREVVREQNELFFVFEFMDGDLLGAIKSAKTMSHAGGSLGGLPHAKVKSYTYQMIQALQHLHKNGWFHRDMKPENLLVKKDPVSKHDTVKLADFGLVKEVRGRPPFTDYVSTRWYRSPEILLQDRAYNSPVDMWAVGCIMVELYTGRPLFPGANEVDQIFKIISVIGAPTERNWPGGLQLAKRIRYQFPTVVPTPLHQFVPRLPPQALDLITALLELDPAKRPTATQALKHPYFNVGIDEEPLGAMPSLRATGTSSAPAGAPQQVGNPPTATAGLGTKPGSEGRPRYPPVEISKPSQPPIQPQVQSNTSATVAAAAMGNPYAKYYIDHSRGLTNVNAELMPQMSGSRRTSGTEGGVPPVASRQTPSPTNRQPAPETGGNSPAGGGLPSALLGPTPQRRQVPTNLPNGASAGRRGSQGASPQGPLKPLTRFSPTAALISTPNNNSGSNADAASSAQRTNAASKPSGLDLDALMRDFAAELSGSSSSVTKANAAGSGRRQVVPLSGPKLAPVGSTPASTKRGTEDPMATFGASAQFGSNGSFRPEASLQELLSSSRYRGSPAKGSGSDGGSPGTPRNNSGRRGVKAISPAVKAVLGAKAAPSGGSPGEPLVHRNTIVPSGTVLHGRRAVGSLPGQTTTGANRPSRLQPMLPSHTGGNH